VTTLAAIIPTKAALAAIITALVIRLVNYKAALASALQSPQHVEISQALQPATLQLALATITRGSGNWEINNPATNNLAAQLWNLPKLAGPNA